MINTTGIDNANTPLQIIQEVNAVSGGVLINMLLFLLWLILLFAFGRENLKKAMVGASFIVVILGILLFAMDLAQWSVLIMPIILFFASIIIYKTVE